MNDETIHQLWRKPLEGLPRRAALDAEPDSPAGRAAQLVFEARVALDAADRNRKTAQWLVVATWALVVADIVIAILR
jgi:hypothetical protein